MWRQSKSDTTHVDPQNYETSDAESSVTGGDSDFEEDVASFNVNDIKQTLMSLDDHHDDDNNCKDDDNDDDDDHVFDICPKKASSVVKSEDPLDVTNRNQSIKEQRIIILQPGMVLMKNYISSDDQASIVGICRDLGIGDGGFYQPGYDGGRKMNLQMMCLGKNWDPDTNMYTELRRSDNTKPPEIHPKFHDIVTKAIQDANDFIRVNGASSDEGTGLLSMSPDICIVNFYSEIGSLGLHQDKSESEESLKKGVPVVSFSIGDSGEFSYGETRAVGKADKVILESGDVLIFGGESRLVYHAVTGIDPDTAPTSLREATGMRPGRLNLTFRKY